MRGVIAKWIQHCLGLVVDMKPENFALKTANGYLLAQILQHYQIISTEQMNMIKNEDEGQACNENLEHLSTWLSRLNLVLNEDDKFEISNGIGTASLHLFYKVFLEVKDKNTLDFVAENVLRQQLKNDTGRFKIKKANLDSPLTLDLHSSELCEPLIDNGDILHWYKDRIDNLETKCVEAKEEYYHSRKKQTRCSLCNQDHETEVHRYFSKSNADIRIVQNPQYDPDLIPNEDVASVTSETYVELLHKQKKCQTMPPFVPNTNKTKEIMLKLKEKQKAKQENRILKNELHRDIMREFFSKINKEQGDIRSKRLSKIFAMQSKHEKQLVSKLGQVKLQKEMMIENKILQDQKLNKLKEDQLIEALVVKGKDLEEKSIAYYCEKERLLQLHKKLWEERKKQEEQGKRKMVVEILQDITDCAIKVAEYKKRYGEEPSRREMYDLKNVFLTGEPVFEYTTPIRVIKEQDCETEQVIKETKRQNEIDIEEFERYMHFEYPWELSNIETTPQTLQEISCGLNILGYIVHQIYLTKYPPAPGPEKPNFPDCDIKVCINGLNDLNCIPTLQKLLSEKEIYVVQLQQVVDYCLNAYQIETKREFDEDESMVHTVKKKKPKSPKKESKKGSKSKSKGKSKIETEEKKSEGFEIKLESENKIVQTPIYFPEEEIPLTVAASLGRTAQEMLASGQPLTDYLLIAMFVEYLKAIPNLKGWVLINFPTTLQQAAILEEHFTGQNFLNHTTQMGLAESIYEIKSITTTDTGGLSQDLVHADAENLTSYLLPNPKNVGEDEKIFDTILTAYIRIKKIDPQASVGEKTLPPVLEELKSPDMDPLDRHYSDLGVNYSLYHREFDFPSIKYLGKLIIGDYSIPPKSSIEIFGDVIKTVDDNTENRTLKSAKMGEKVPKKLKGPHPSDIPSKKDDSAETSSQKNAKKKNKKEKKTVKKKKSKVLIVHEDKTTQLPEVDESPREEEVVAEGIEPPTPGKDGWEYSTVFPPEELQIALATVWEDVEEVYVEDIKQICFMCRLQRDTLMPFSQYIKDKMRTSIEKPDQKAEFLQKFQKAFNAFDMDFRRDDEFKCEMHCRIEDFKEKLSEIADKKMMELEEERCNMISQNWAPTQLCELLNDYVNIFQIESDRFCETMRLADDYYWGIFTGRPCSIELSLRDEIFPKYKNIDPVVLNPMFKNTEVKLDMTFFENELSKMLENGMNLVKKYHTFSNEILEKAKAIKLAGDRKIKKPKNTKKDDQKVLNVAALDKEKSEKLIEEWSCATQGEIARITLRYELIRAHALKLLEEFVTVVKQAFQSVYLDIKKKYDNEIENIDNACKVLRFAVEKETALDNELIFVGDNFYINPEISVVEPLLPTPELNDDLLNEGAFTINQLLHLTDILFDLSPKGYIPLASFEHLIQDVIWNDPEDGRERLGPSLWKNLDPISLKKLIEDLFDKLEYVYWKDFIIYNLRVAFPTERELLLIRHAFRDCDPDDTELVTDYQFFSTKLWFELSYSIDNESHLRDIKKLLYKLYRVENGGVNYTAFLLDFCKDDLAVVGFTKALELAVGKQICWDPILGSEFVDQQLKKTKKHEEAVKMRDEEKAAYYNAAYEFVEGLVDHVVHIKEDVIIEDITDPEPEEVKTTSSSKINVKENKSITEVGSIKKVEIVELNSDQAKESKSEDEKEMKEQDDGEVETNNDEKLKAKLPSAVGFEAMDHTKIAFFLPLDVLISVITSSIPWHCRIKNPGEPSFWEEAAILHNSFQNPNFSNSVLAHEFLNSDKFLKILRKTKKFTIKDPVRILNDILNI